MSYRANNGDSSDDERPSLYRYWNTRQPTTPTFASTLNPYMRIGRNPTGRNLTPLQTSVLRPPSQTGPGTETSGSASFHSVEQGPESESETGPTDEATFHYEPELNTETQLPIQEPKLKLVITMALTTMTSGERMDVDHEGKRNQNYLMETNEKLMTSFMHATFSLKEAPTKISLPTNRRSYLYSLT